MAKELSENTSFQVSLKTLSGIAFLITTLVTMWFTLKADIAEAKLLPEPLDPEITRMEFDLEGQLIRQTILNTQEDLSEIKDDLKSIKQKLFQR